MKFLFLFLFLSVSSVSLLCAQSKPPVPQEGQLGWYKQQSGTTENLKRVQFFSRTNGWVVGQAGDAYRTIDGGNNWTKVLPPPEYAYVYFQNDSTGYCIGTTPDGKHYTLRKSKDYCVTWTEPVDYLQGEFGWKDMVTFGDTLLIMSTSSSVSRSSDGGKSWTRSGAPISFPQAMHFCDPAHGYIVGEKIGFPQYAGFAYTTDGGKIWEPVVTEIKTTLYDVFAVSEKKVFAAGLNETIAYSTNGGNQWDTIPWLPGQIGYDGYSSVHFVNSINGLIVGSDGKIIRTNDGGITWFEQKSSVRYGVDTNDNVVIWDVFLADSLYAWAVGDGSIILHTTDAGKSWVRQFLPTPVKTSVLPEPFAQKTSITYSLPQSSKATIRIFDMTGRELEVIESRGIQEAGTHTIEFDGSRYPSGAFYYRLEADGVYGTGKMTKIAQ